MCMTILAVHGDQAYPNASTWRTTSGPPLNVVEGPETGKLSAERHARAIA